MNAKNYIKISIKNLLHRVGLDVIQHNPHSENKIAPDLTERENVIIGSVRPYTMTSVEKMATLINTIKYLVRNQIPGDIAECGVWKGGSMMLVAQTLMALGETNRSIYLYDTFEGMPEPTKNDLNRDGMHAKIELENTPKKTGIWCYAGLDEVKNNLLSTGYPEGRFFFIKGKVEETIPKTMPGNLALLRIDTDWYESTKHELVHLFPLLAPRGALIIDDYGYWEGARKAVDEYFGSDGGRDYLHRIGTSGRVLIKRE